jgi:hypothetical protein
LRPEKKQQLDKTDKEEVNEEEEERENTKRNGGVPGSGWPRAPVVDRLRTQQMREGREEKNVRRKTSAGPERVGSGVGYYYYYYYYTTTTNTTATTTLLLLLFVGGYNRRC